MTDDRGQHEREYDPPEVDDVPAEDGPAVTAASGTNDGSAQGGPEWRQADDCGRVARRGE